MQDVQEEKLTASQQWARDQLNKVLVWGLSVSLLLAGWAISNGRNIGFRVYLPDNFEAWPKDVKSSLTKANMTSSNKHPVPVFPHDKKLAWLGDWTDRDEPGAALLWALILALGLSFWLFMIRRLLQVLKGVCGPTLLPRSAVSVLAAAVCFANIALWTVVSFT